MNKFLIQTNFIKRFSTTLHTPFILRTNVFYSTKKLESWEEVELNRPRAPTLEGYVRPPKSPVPTNIPRHEFHEFIRGTPKRFSKELKVFLTGWFFFIWVIALNWLTVKLMKPDDFSWVDDERKKMEATKNRLTKYSSSNLTSTEV